MKNIILIICILKLGYISSTYGQFYNDGAEVTIQENALVHIQGDFINQGGSIDNQGLIELGGDWINSVSSNPLIPGAGLVELVGDDQIIGGDFNTLFYNLNFFDNQSLSLQSTIGIQNGINLNNGYIELNSNILHILNSDNTALSVTNGGIISEISDTLGLVRWDIGEIAMGTYTVPFANAQLNSIPLATDVVSQGIGEQGYLLFGTYGTDEDNTPLPQDISNITVEGDNTGFTLVDRFWFVDGVDYTSLPISRVSFAYDQNSEIGGLNEIDPGQLEIINWDDTSGEWSTISESTSSNNMTSGVLDNTFGYFSLWSEVTSSLIDPEKIIDLSVFPNPTKDNLTLEFSNEGSEYVQVFIFDNIGQVMSESDHLINNGQTKIDINTSTLTQGSYYLLLKGETINANKKFLKQ